MATEMKTQKNISPPRWLLRFFRWYCHPDFAEDIEGDLCERFARNAAETSLRKARWRFGVEVLLLFRPGIIRPILKNHPFIHYGMFKHHFKIAFRLFKKETTYSLINISGLALGFTCCLLIGLFIKDELSYDNFHQDGERIYRVASAYMREAKWEPYSSNSWLTGEKIKTQFGEIEQLVRIRERQEIVTFGDKKFDEQRLASADENFFEIFSFPLISGSRDEALKGPNKVVISKSIAEKYFGNEDAMGKVLDMRDGAYQLQVSGIMEDMPPNSHFHFDFLISGETARQIDPEALFTNVGWDSQYLYIKMKKGSDPLTMESLFPDFVDNHLAPFTSGIFKLFLQPLADIHLRSHNGLEIEPNGNITHVYIFSIIALFILIIACVNYMNLTTARSLRRAKEVGMRKVLGANQSNLIGQFLIESFILTCIAIFIAIGLTLLILPEFNEFAGKEISGSVLFDPTILTILLISPFVIAFLSGAYPSFILSAFKPLNTLKKPNPTGKSGLSLRKGLVVLQFVISIGLIAATSIVFEQLGYLKNKELGINKELLVAVPLKTMLRSQLDGFKSELLANSAITRVGVSNMKMPGWISNSTYYKAEGIPVDEEIRQSMKIIRIDHDFLGTVEAEIVKGRNFSKTFPSDMTSSIILNEAAIGQLGWEDPVGKWIELSEQRFEVVGLVKDFHFESLHRKIPPTIFILSPDWLNWAYVKVDARNIPATVGHIESVYSKFVTDREFSYSFVDEDVAQQYQAEEKFTEVFTIFTILAIVLACLGTFGLVSFSAEQKTKEIGIRKVLGASVGSVTFLLIKEFVILLLVASLIAWPITYYFMNGWIEAFIYRTNIEIEAFITATILALLIAIGTTGFRAMKAALANPAQSLRDE
ncbi:MAG: FtsX-like permease family protein [Bacteroidia bacterium]|nr:FtsX-like permease family protein [Bacteroidia bacterium]